MIENWADFPQDCDLISTSHHVRLHVIYHQFTEDQHNNKV